MSSLAKPVLRGHIKRRGLKVLFGAVTLAGINGTLVHFLVGNPRRAAYEEFVKTYDVEEHYKELKKYGYITLSVLEEEVQAAKG